MVGTGGGKTESERLKVPLLAEIPLEILVRLSGDQGKPVVLSQPEAATSKAFREAARVLIQSHSLRNR